VLLASLTAQAAPLDALLSAYPEPASGRSFVEIDALHMNGALDVFRVRESDPATAGTRAGDYRGRQLMGGWRLGDALWLTGSLSQRAVSDTTDTHQYGGWQLGAQYRFRDADDHWPALALRLSAWGHQAGAVQSTTPVTVPGAILNTVRITDPADRNVQADLIGSWKLSPAWQASALLSAGVTRLSYGSLSATTRRDGCNYQLSFTGNDIFGRLIPPCAAPGGVIEQFFDSSGDYGVDVARELAWRGNFVQLGGNVVWREGAWKLAGGYLFHAIKRESVDDILASRGKSSFDRNHLVLLEADYRVNPWLSLVGRGQFSSRLLFNELPVTYNSSSAARFGRKYSLFTLGLRAEF
jgi:hypothetical protein